MGGLRISNELILAKIEAVYGTDPVPVQATDAVLVREIGFAPEGLRMNDRGAIRASIGQLQSVPGGQLKRLTYKCEVKGSGAAGTAPEIGPLLRACGMAETIVGATSVTYKPRSSGHESITQYFYEGGRKRHILTGCRGNVSFAVEAGGIMFASFDLVGHHSGPTDQAQPTPTYNAQVPRAAIGMPISFNGVTAIVGKNWSFGLNNVVATPPSIAATDGYGEIIITGRKVTGALLKESELVAVLDPDALLSAGTRFAFDSGLLGSVAGNRVRLTTPAASTYVMDQELQEGDGVRLRNVPVGVDDSTADQEISLIFT